MIGSIFGDGITGRISSAVPLNRVSAHFLVRYRRNSTDQQLTTKTQKKKITLSIIISFFLMFE
jgi:hypothetical protein